MADFDSIGFQVATHNDDEHVTFYDILDTYTQTASEEEIDLDQIHTVNYVLSYKRNLWLTILFYFLCFATLGILPLICHWYPFVMLYMTHLKSDKSNATAVLLESTMSKQKSVEYVREVDMMIPDSYTRVRVFKYRHACFIYDPRKNDFVRVTFNFAKSFSEITQTLSSGINATTRIIRKTLFGSNGVNIEVKNPIALLLDEVLHPFYIFQLFSVILWCFEEYWIYAMVIFFSSTISALVSLIETRRNLINLRNMAKHSCEIIRYSPVPERVDSDAIVPGDVIELENDMLLPCDVILLSGECIVNESMLTGESIPVVKSPIPKEGGNEIYSLNKHKNMTLFAGTKIVQVKRRGDEKVNGVCVKTGFDTAKGKLILSILFPRPTDFKYYRDSFRFIGILSLIALVGMVYTIIKYIKLKYGVKDIILRTGDLVTIVVPPALPVAITVGAALAIRRLKQVKIFCISPPRVNVAGVINCMCFDKTGTLTEDGLDLNALQVANSGVFATTIEAENITSFINSSIKETETTNSYLAYALATCHSLALVENKMIGDPLEQAIFSTLNFQIVDPQEHHDLETLSVIKTCTANQTTTHQYNSEFSDSFTPNMNSEEELYIMKRFEFSSDLKRMSVIVRDSSRREYSFVKGSPEHLRSLCDPSSVPHNFDQILFNYTFNGDRVLACGYKPINYYPAISREEADCNIIFLGLIIMQNRMKPESPVTIKQLHDAKIQNIMVTGDNSLTAVFIAKQSGIIEPGHRIYIGDIVNNEVQWKDVELDSYLDPISLKPFTRTVDHRYDLAITGNAFEALYADFNKRDPTHDFEGDPPLFHKLLVMCKVYARMSPEQKRVVSEELQKIDYFVGFCGDGANDTASLKASHIGISLSQAEASIAAPFTSMVANISCVPKVIREGRAALATTFQLFKYMALYSLIQFFTVVLLYSYYSTLGNYQFLFVDLLIIIPTSFLLSKTAASDHLGDERPSSSLLNPIVFLSVTVQMIIPALTMIISLVRLHRQEWYRATFSGDGTDAIQGMENTTLFYLSTVHTYFLAYAYSISKPFKKPLYTNKLFCSVLVILLALQIYVVLLPDVRFTAYWLELDIHIPMKWRVEILIYCAVHFVLSFLFEYIVIAGPGKKIVDAVFKGKFSLLVRKVQNMRAKQTQAEKFGHSGKKYNHIKLKLMQNHTAFSDDVASPTEENLANTV